LKRAREDPAIVAFWLGGSRGMGRATEHSDYDCQVMLDDAAPEALRREIVAFAQPGLDLGVLTLSEFEGYAAWGSAEAWARYGHAHLRAIIDKTGRAQPLIDSKSCVPPEALARFIDASLDHLLNQLYRGLKCLRDGDPVASRLEAAQAVAPFLDAVFALHGGRLRPYYKYLVWELATFPLELLPFDGRTVPVRLERVLGPDAAFELQSLVSATHGMFREAGHGGAFDAWDEAMDWMLTWRPPND
jgi:hypothetical protein